MDDLPYNVIIPAAGESQRFKAAGYTLPKGLIRFTWKGVRHSMIQHILRDNVPVDGIGVVVCKQINVNIFMKLLHGYSLYPIFSSEGQAHTVYQGIEYMHERELLIINCDNAFDMPLKEFVDACRQEGADCGAVVFKTDAGESKYGYVDKYPHFDVGIEKQPISPYALAGAFYFQSVTVYRNAFRRVNKTAGYISEMFAGICGKKLAYLIPREALHEWGTPDDLKADKTVELG